MTKTVLSRAVAAALVTLTGVSSIAHAALEEVIVTAEKRAESIQDVPISIMAFSNDKLEKLGITDVKGLAAQVPNVQVGEFTGSSTTVRLFIRGVGQGDIQITQDPSVALYMDGVYIGSSVGAAFETADTERIEVLRGPQGTLYGRNATGGAINIITRPADPEALEFKQTFQVGNYDAFRSSTILNVPITDTTAVKLAYTNYDRDGIVDNEGNGEDFGIEDRETFIGDFHWTVGDRGELDYKYEHSTIEDTARLSQALGFEPNRLVQFENPDVDSNGIPVEATEDRLDDATSFDVQQKGDNTIKAHTLNFAWEINDSLTFKSITGYRDLNAFTQNAQAPTAYLSLGGNKLTITNGLPYTDFNQFTQEFQLLGDTDTLSWVGGIFYYEDDAEEDISEGNSAGSELLPEGTIVDFTTTENTSVAMFGQVTWTPPALEERWHFTLGARYSDDSREATRDNNRVSFLLGQPTGVSPFRAKYDKDFDKFNPSFTVEYDLNDFSNVYAKVVTAYKSGGTSQRSTSRVNFEEGFTEEDLVSYELGFKGDMLDGRLRINAALFHMEYDDYQQSVPTGNNAGERDFVNIEDADITGLEMDITGVITDEITGSLSYGYLDTDFGPETITYLALDTSSPDGVSEVTEPLTDDLALAPEHSATASLDYTRALAFGTFNANVNVQYQDESLSGVLLPAGVINDRTVVGANLSLSDIELGEGYGYLRVMLWGRNLTDEEYHIGNIRQNQFDSLGFTSGVATFGDPRMYGVTLEYQYN